MEAYFDNSATTRPSAPVRNLIQELLSDGWFNPSALYRPAMLIQKRLDDTRQICLEAAGAAGNRIIFTSGGTESDNLAILGTLKTRRPPGRVLISSIEHPAVSACADEIRKLGFSVEAIPVDSKARIDTAWLEKNMRGDVVLVAVMQVNNETGTVQPLEEIAALRDRICPEAAIHVDGVQGFMRVPLSFNRLGIQSYAFSGHKIGGLKGTGALIIRKGHRIKPLFYGGGQENNDRSGTENTFGILSMGEAVRTYDTDANRRMNGIKTALWERIITAVPGAEINGPECDSPESAPHILNVSLMPVRSQTMLFALEGDGIYVSAGSACASRKQKISPVLKAMGLATDRADCSLRFSLSPETTPDEAEYAAERTAFHYNELKRYTRR